MEEKVENEDISIANVEVYAQAQEKKILSPQLSPFQKIETILAAKRSLKLAELIKSAYYQEKNKENLAKWGAAVDSN